MMKKALFAFAVTTAVALGTNTTHAFVQSGYASVVAGNLNCFTFPATCFENSNPRQTIFVPGEVYLVRNINNSGIDRWYTINSSSRTTPEDPEPQFELQNVPQNCPDCHLQEAGH